jgi:uncharacterized damage-inducible protein DinB
VRSETYFGHKYAYNIVCCLEIGTKRGEGNMLLSDLLVENKESIRQRTRNIFPRITDDKLGFAPIEGALTLGQILHHLWMSEEGLTKIVSHENWEYFEQRMGARLVDILGQVGPLQHELDNLERVHAQTITLIRALPDDAFAKEHVSEELKFKRTTFSILLGLGEHEAHHRGQVATYLHMLGDAAPSPYLGFK